MHIYDLPPEILFLIQIYSLSSNLPIASKKLYNLFQEASTQHKAIFLFFKTQPYLHNRVQLLPESEKRSTEVPWNVVYSFVFDESLSTKVARKYCERIAPNFHIENDENFFSQCSQSVRVFNKSLRYPICDAQVLTLLNSNVLHWGALTASSSASSFLPSREKDTVVRIPNRLWTNIPPCSTSDEDNYNPDEACEECQMYSGFRYVHELSNFFNVKNHQKTKHEINANLFKSVVVGNSCLIHKFMDQDADPFSNNGLPIKTAIKLDRQDLVSIMLRSTGYAGILRAAKSNLFLVNDLATKCMAKHMWDCAYLLNLNNEFPLMTIQKVFDPLSIPSNNLSVNKNSNIISTSNTTSSTRRRFIRNRR